MKHIKTYESFWPFSKKENQRMGSIEFLDWVISNYKKFEDNKKYYFFNISIGDDSVSVSYNSRELGDYHVMLVDRDGKYVMIDFNNPETGKMGEQLPKSGKYRTWDIDISKETFDKYHQQFKIIDDYLDNKDEKEHEDSKTSIGSEGLLNFKDDPVERAGLIINQHLSKYTNRSFKFDTDYIIWTSGSENNSRDKEIEETEFKITEFKLGIYGTMDENDKRIKFYGKLVADWSMDGKEYEIMIEPEYKPEWIDLNDVKNHRVTLRPHSTEKFTRKQSKERFTKDKFPMKQLMSIAPSKYDTIEMLNEFVEIINDINNQVKDKS